MLSQDDWNRLQQLFHAACALPIPERDAFAQAQAGDEPELLRELLAMLDVEEAATEAVRKPLREVATSLPIASELPAGTRFGPWQVERLIGKGGMGQVYLGQRADGAYELKVAIKVIGTQQSDSQRRAYFEFERQLLAQMQHPAIAQILDAGSDEHGRLYLVMEYVEGQSLTHWCSEHKLSLRERVKLLIRVTEGVQHAHQKGVIHRDLKPGNILISDVAGEPVPKIIDFGIAARTSDEGTQAMLVAAGTPGYMSPEQVSPDMDVDSRSDVYSLGAILFELVSGKRPRGTRTTSDSSNDPLRPSDRIQTLSPEEMSDLAAKLRTPPQRLRRVLRHDLDWIVARATQPDRSLRYPSATSFSDDLKRWLDGYPPQAAPHRRWRSMSKFIGRNRMMVAMYATLAIAVIGGLIATSWALHRAEQAIAGEKAANRFLSDVLTSVDPAISFDLDKALMQRVLNNASERIKTDLAKQPLARANIETTLAQTYINLGDSARGVEHLQSAYAIASDALGKDSLPAQTAIMELANQHTVKGELTQAEQLMRDNLPAAFALSAEDPLLAPRTQSRLGRNLHLQGRLDEAMPLLREAYETLLDRVGPEHQRSIDAGQFFAIGLGESGKMDEATLLMRELTERQARLQGEDHPQTLALRNSLAGFLAASGNTAAAETEFRTLIEAVSRQHGTMQAMLPSLQANLALALNANDDPKKRAEAGALFQQAIDGLSERHGTEHPNLIMLNYHHANWLFANGQIEAARDKQAAVVTSIRKKFGDSFPRLPEMLHALARQELALGHAQQARQHAEEAIARIQAKPSEQTAALLEQLRQLLSDIGTTQQAAPR